MRKNIKIISLFVIGFFITAPVFATILTITYTNEQPSTLIRSSRWNQDMSDIQTFLNSNQLDSTDNIKAGGISTTALANLAVTDAKIAGITTAGKVSGAALTSLTSVPSGAGLMPIANIGSGPAFWVDKGGSNQTGIVTATPTTVTWGTEQLDTNNNFASNTFTPTVAGKYFLSATIKWLGSTDQIQYNINIVKNGSSVLTNQTQSSGTGSFNSFVGGIVTANGSTDAFTITCRQATGSNQSIDGTATDTYFQGFFVSQ